MSEKKFVKTTSASTGRDVYHTDEYCRHLQSATNYRPASDHEIAVHELSECTLCAGDKPNHDGGDLSAFMNLKKAAEAEQRAKENADEDESTTPDPTT